MSMEPTADRQYYPAPLLEEPPVKERPKGGWFFAASLAAHLAVLGIFWFLGSLLPPVGNGDVDGVMITLTYGKPGSGTPGEPAGAGGGMPVPDQASEQRADAAASPPAAEPAPRQKPPASQKHKAIAEPPSENSRSPLAIPRLAAKTPAKKTPETSRQEKRRTYEPRQQKKAVSTPNKNKALARAQEHASIAAITPGQSLPVGAGTGALSGASRSKLQGQGMATAAGTGMGRGRGTGGQGTGAANEGQGDAGGYLKGNYEYIKKRIRQYLEYSPQAKRMGIQGLVYVAFTITRDGTAQNVELRTSSGFDSLDESALEAVHRASPFAPPPHAARVVVPIQFSLR